MISTLPLQRYCDFSEAERLSMSDQVDSALDAERQWEPVRPPFIDSIAVCDRIVELELVKPDLARDKFGVVSPIRDRRPQLTDALDAQSYPYLTHGAHNFLRSVVRALYSEVMQNRDEFEVEDIAFSITSLLRTSRYQELIVRDGRLASIPTEKFSSSHCLGAAFDVDHGGGYVLNDGMWIKANPEINFELWLPVRRRMREVFMAVVQEDVEQGKVNVIDEVPNGWGTYHVAVRDILSTNEGV